MQIYVQNFSICFWIKAIAKICNDSRSRSKSYERINFQRRGKESTINFETFEKTSIYSSIDLMPFLKANKNKIQN